MNFELVAKETLEFPGVVEGIFYGLSLIGIPCQNESDLIGFIANENQFDENERIQNAGNN